MFSSFKQVGNLNAFIYYYCGKRACGNQEDNFIELNPDNLLASNVQMQGMKL